MARVYYYYFYKTIIISRLAICLFFVIYCHHCSTNRCRTFLYVSSRAHEAETSRYWCATDIICTNFKGLQTRTRYARPICRYIEIRFYREVLMRLYMWIQRLFFNYSAQIIIAFNPGVKMCIRIRMLCLWIILFYCKNEFYNYYGDIFYIKKPLIIITIINKRKPIMQITSFSQCILLYSAANSSDKTRDFKFCKKKREKRYIFRIKSPPHV